MASDSVDRIKEKLSIVDVISPYVELHKAGKNFKGKSPFTSEKTPSFYVSPDRGMYYCFSSSQGGDIFTFIQKMEGVDFKGALKILAEKAGVELVPEDPKKRDWRGSLYQALEEATKFFEAELGKSKDASDYLQKRKVNSDTKTTWRIGYAPNDWRQLREHLNKKGFEDKALLEAGLVKQADGGKQPYDVFRDRVMFPIQDPSGRVIGFSGRILSKDSEAPKYVNSPETQLFNKSEALFGYDKAKHGIHKLDFSLIVEGQFDVVLSHQAGYKNTVAVSGTALTAGHVSLLQRLSNRVVLALDSDRAGVAAVKRAAELMLARGIDLKVARLHGGKDPADLVAEDPALLKRDIKDAKHVIEFLLEILKEETGDARKFKVRARDEILPYLLQIESHIERDHFVEVVAKAIDSNLESVRLELARLETAKAREPEQRLREPERESSHPAPAHLGRKQALMNFLAVLEELLTASEGHMLAERFIAIVGKSPKEIRDELSPTIQSELVFKLEDRLATMQTRHIREEWENSLRELESLLVKEKIMAAKQELVTAEEGGNETEAARILNIIDELKSRI
jgi:DNA primase